MIQKSKFDVLPYLFPLFGVVVTIVSLIGFIHMRQISRDYSVSILTVKEVTDSGAETEYDDNSETWDNTYWEDVIMATSDRQEYQWTFKKDNKRDLPRVGEKHDFYIVDGRLIETTDTAASAFGVIFGILWVIITGGMFLKRR